MGDKHDAGKGDKYRRVDSKTWERNWTAIFGKKAKAKRPRTSNERKGTR